MNSELNKNNYKKNRELIESYIMERGGRHVIQRIFIANNGIAAVKGIRSMRRWSYETFGHDSVFCFVAMTTPEDLRSDAEYLQLADSFEEVPGGPNANNYANVNLIVEKAQRTKCDAVWAGWGHASENPNLPRALKEANIIWIGPPAEAMEALGDKVGSTIIAQSTGVRVMPWSGSGIFVDYKRENIPKEKYANACVMNADEAIEKAKKIGFPLMIKASAGGGGKGIRKLESAEEIPSAFRQVVSEVAGPVFMMKMATFCRHLEVQVIADEYHNAMALFGRDCSLQRRHQKIIEEGPVSTNVCPDEKWEKMELDAVRLCNEVGYAGAGTVEYLYFGEGDYCFLELNPRLQVEHPVSELISNVNLPVTQLLIAMGVPLHSIPQIRSLYKLKQFGKSVFDLRATKPKPKRHVIACRITAENPEADFSPTSGLIHSLHFRSTPDVWGYFSVRSKGSLHEFADSQFGHLFAVGKNRESARKKMVLALSELLIRGEISTTVEFLRRVLETEDFIKNNFDTTWIERNIKGFKDHLSTHSVVVSAALFKAFSHLNNLKNGLVKRLRNGNYSLPKKDTESLNNLDTDLIYENVKYSLTVEKHSEEHFSITFSNKENQKHQDWRIKAMLKAARDGGILMSFWGRSRLVYGSGADTDQFVLTVNNCSRLFSKEKDPSAITSSVSGKLICFLAEKGERILKGQAVAEVEVMKIVVPLISPGNGVFRPIFQNGAVVRAGDVVANVELDEEQIKNSSKVKIFNGSFPAETNFLLSDNLLKPHKTLSDNGGTLENIFEGYSFKHIDLKKATEGIIKSFLDPFLFFEEVEDVLSALRNRMAPGLLKEISDCLSEGKNEINLMSEEKKRASFDSQKMCFSEEITDRFPKFLKLRRDIFYVQKVQTLLDKFLDVLTEKQLREASKTLNKLSSTLHKYRNGNLSYGLAYLSNKISRAFEFETFFENSSNDESLKEICDKEKSRNKEERDFESVLKMASSHNSAKVKSKIVLSFIDSKWNEVFIKDKSWLKTLRFLGNLKNSVFEELSIKCRAILSEQKLKEMGYKMNFHTNQRQKLIITPNKSQKHLNLPYSLKIENKLGFNAIINAIFSENKTKNSLLSLIDKENGFINDCMSLLLKASDVFIRENFEMDKLQKINSFYLNVENIKINSSYAKYIKKAFKKCLTKNWEKLKTLRVTCIIFRLGEFLLMAENKTSLFWVIKGNKINENKNLSILSILEKEKTDAVKEEIIKRMAAERTNTFYIKDLPYIFKKAVKNLNRKYGIKSKETAIFKNIDNRSIKPSGVHFWEVHLTLPFCPKKSIIVVANDITHAHGTTTPQESKSFCRALSYARKRKLPVLYVASNSGAKIGVEEEVFKRAKVSFRKNRFDFLFLEESDSKRLREKVFCVPKFSESEGRTVFKIERLLELKNVENLAASAKMASAMARANKEITTLSFVTGRSVGIGAYLVRLGQRVVQKRGSPILLTGFNALNKILGNKIYTSNLQIGGTNVMAFCGVSHLVAKDDLEGFEKCLLWLSFPLSAPLHSFSLRCDPPFRPIEKKTDTIIDGSGGIFDTGSFLELQKDWAKSVIIGRARLGGIPCGVIYPEKKTTEKIIPADPAIRNSKEISLNQPGQVWFPDSSQKTARAISDTDKEGLPLFIIANWRGFSGGMRDMFEEVIKFGADIVYSLIQYKNPVFVYIPEGCELRGGAFVVIDRMINSVFIESYASPGSKANILEPEGLMDVKLREDKVLKMVGRTEEKIDNGEYKVNENYRQAALKFAELHDDTSNLVKSGVLNGVIPFSSSREFFFWRLRVRMEEIRMLKKIKNGLGMAYKKSKEVLEKFLKREGLIFGEGTKNDKTENKKMAIYLEGNKIKAKFESFLEDLVNEKWLKEVKEKMRVDKDFKNALEGLINN